MAGFSVAEAASESRAANDELDRIDAEYEQQVAEIKKNAANERRNAQGLQPLHAAAMGVTGSVGSMGSGLRLLGAERVGGAIEEWGEETGEAIRDDMSDESRQAMDTPLTVADEDATLGVKINPDAGWGELAMHGASGVGSVGASLATGGPVSALTKKGVMAAAAKMSPEVKVLVEAGAKSRTAAETVFSPAAKKAAGATGAAVGYGGTAGVMEGGGAGAETEDAIDRLKDEQLDKLEPYLEIYHREVVGNSEYEGLDVQQKRDVARAIYRGRAAKDAALDVGGKAALVGTVAGKVLERSVLGKSDSLARGMAASTLSEGFEEGYIAGESKQAVNVATGKPEDEGYNQIGRAHV